MERYKYRLVTPFTEQGPPAGFYAHTPDINGWLKALNELGLEGWEAVGEISLRMEGASSNYPQILLKRRLA